MDARREFVRLAGLEGANRRELCRRFGIHPDTGYKWLRRAAADAPDLADRSRRPHSSPARTAEATEGAIGAIRDAHPAWGARKIAHCLKRDGVKPPAVSTVHEVLRRHGRILPPQGGGAADQRFETVTCPPEKRVIVGQTLFKWVEQDANFPLCSVRERFLSHGSHHILSNRYALGWHPDYKSDADAASEDGTC
jgi:transposase